MVQLITPNPDIPCKPGWCLAYVNEAFRVPKRFGSATAAWNASGTKHRDYDFPAGVWVPIWFSLKYEPNGHVALRAPDGSIYSTTSPTGTTPTHHPNLAHLIAAYARYNPLTFLGWTEDVEGTAVLAPGSISPQGTTTTPLEGFLMELSADEQRQLHYVLCTDEGRQIHAQKFADVLLRTTLHMKDGGTPVLEELLAVSNDRLGHIKDSTDLLPALNADLRGEADVVEARDAAQAAADAAANDQLVALLAEKQGLSVEDIRAALAGAIADGITVTVGGSHE